MIYDIMSIPIIESPWLYDVVTKWRGIPDPRRPNGKKPFYRKVTIKIPKGYMMGRTLVAHPDFVKKLREQVTP